MERLHPIRHHDPTTPPPPDPTINQGDIIESDEPIRSDDQNPSSADEYSYRRIF